MGEFTHAMRNPIRERDDRINQLTVLLQEARTQLMRTDTALRRLLADGVTQIEHIDTAIAGQKDSTKAVVEPVQEGR